MAYLSTIAPDYIFESSWEVCNKVGGIYTVLSTRANTLQTLFQDKIIFIGPDLWKDRKNPDFIERKTVLKEWRKQAVENENLPVRVGRWNIPGQPIAVLVDFHVFDTVKDEFYFQMWKLHGIDSTVAYGDYDEACLFSYAAVKVIESLYLFMKGQDKKVLAHFNEWTLGMAALYLHDQLPKVATLFTTHATSVGRAIADNNKPLYEQFSHYNGDQMARELNVVGKHQLEKQAAHTVDCFTTVSDITGMECSQLLDKTPHVIIPNGFEAGFIPQAPIFDAQRATARKALIRVAEQLTGDPISEEALLVATSGRYEYRNKGLDVFIESIHRVKQAQPNRPIIAFILVPAWINGARKDLQERLAGKKQAKKPLPHPYITHELVEPQNDKISQYLHYLHFTNQETDPVKLIFVPSYLKGDDGIFNLPYYELLTGFDLTIFPSYYEPWGYTPLESIAFQIPTITSNLAGFGLWAQSKKAGDLASGVKVIERTDANYFEVAEEIKNTIIEYAGANVKQVAKIRKASQALSQKASWEHFIQHYLKAYTLALKNK
jgi:glycosyltransferase involved in cell wall biosynthesis